MYTPFRFIGAACGILLLLCSCNSKKQQTADGYSEYAKPEQTETVQKMKDYHYSAEVISGPVRYTYDIVREANDTLPVVNGEDEEQFADNYIRLRVNRNDREIFNKVFTKNSFNNYIEADFIRHSILEGMAFDRTTPQGLRFAVSVSYPASDIYIPLSITIDDNGGYQITKDEILDNIVEESDSTEV